MVGFCLEYFKVEIKVLVVWVFFWSFWGINLFLSIDKFILLGELSFLLLK